MCAFLALALGSPWVAGCYCSHERDPREDGGTISDGAADAPLVDAARADAARRDADIPEGRYWIAVDVESFEVEHERCAVREGQTLVLRVRLTTDGCDEPGNVRWSVDAATRQITLAPFVWRPQGVAPCPPFAREIVRDVALRGARLSAGTWEVVLPFGTRVAVEVGPAPPELTCAGCLEPGEPCAVDDECMGLRECVSIRGDAECESRCASSCQPFDEADLTGTDLACSQRLGPSACMEDPNLGWTCGAASEPCARCADGTECPRAACEWTVTAWPSDCTTDRDCPGGRSCVEQAAGNRSCLVRCRGDHPCPLGEYCGPSDQVCPSPKI